MQIDAEERASVSPEGAGDAPADAMELATESEQAAETQTEQPAPTREARPTGLPSAEVQLLGDFSVSYDGEPAVIPLGHAAQALKIVALFRRISVDALAELLWPDAEPGVGARRLRNILWRIKSSSGDIVRRSDNLICLEDSVVTDVGAFEEAAGLAFDEGRSPEEAAALAREAISKYGGELLPSDRYADWTAGPREALNQKRLQLLDLLYIQALDGGNRQEALGLLEELIAADPYEERYYLQLASLHLEAGNRSRMRAVVSRGERMLADLGVAPSPSFVEFVSSVRDQ
jgi:DNA-binding SARP family transcriptional activator